MNRQFFTTLWNHMWQQHVLVKGVLTFSFKSEDEIKKTEIKQGQVDSSNQRPPLLKKSQWIGLFLDSALFFFIMFFLPPKGMSPEAKAVLAVTAWVATWWITEAIPIPATSLLPIVLFPMTGALATREVAAVKQ